MPSLTLTSPGAIAFHLGPLSIRWYGLLITGGFLLSMWAASRLAKQNDIDVDGLLNCALVSFIGGIIGARLYFVALSWPSFAAHPGEILQIWLGGLSIHGGIIGGAITGYVYTRFSKLPFLRGLDIVAAVVALAQSIGRWGNFFNSEAFGRPVAAAFPLKLYIPESNRPSAFATSPYFQPTFLYESVWDFGVFLLIYFVLYDKLKKYPGMTFLVWLFLYSVGRTLIEPLRSDSIMIGGMAAPLIVSASTVVLSGIGIFLLYRHYQNKQSQSPAEERLQKDAKSERLHEEK